MGKKNSFLAKQEELRKATYEAAWSTCKQYMCDLICLELKDKRSMGKNTFGEKRILAFMDGIEKNYDRYFNALVKADDTLYLRQKLDENLQRNCSFPIVEFTPRYPYVVEVDD